MSSVAIDVEQLPLDGEGGLMEVIRTLPDPRKRRGIRHSIESVIALSTLAVLSGMKSFEAIAEWVQDVPVERLRQLGCRRDRGPSEPTIRRILMAIDTEEVDRRLGTWLDEILDRDEAIAVDGKALRGSGDGEENPRHLLGAITHVTGVVVAQEEVEEKTNEITRVQPLLHHLDLEGRTVTADAMHTQVSFARWLIEEKGADYVFIVKDNQPTLRSDIEAVEWDLDSPTAVTFDKGHGRIETRRIWLTDELSDYLTFPHAGVAFRLEREIRNLDGSLRHHEVVYGVTSIRGTGEKAGTNLLAKVRGHWVVENRLYWVRDETFAEDKSQVRKKGGPRAMATLRNLAISLIRLARGNYIARSVRWLSRHLDASFRLIGIA